MRAAESSPAAERHRAAVAAALIGVPHCAQKTPLTLAPQVVQKGMRPPSAFVSLPQLEDRIAIQQFYLFDGLVPAGVVEIEKAANWRAVLALRQRRLHRDFIGCLRRLHVDALGRVRFGNSRYGGPAAPRRIAWGQRRMRRSAEYHAGIAHACR